VAAHYIQTKKNVYYRFFHLEYCKASSDICFEKQLID